MGQKIQLTAGDGHVLQAYLAEPTGKPRGGIVVIQEIFGVTRHIRDVAEQFGRRGNTSRLHRRCSTEPQFNALFNWQNGQMGVFAPAAKRWWRGPDRH